MTLGSGQRLSHYRLVEKVGEGGMGVVWKAEDTILNRFVAVKVLPSDASRDERRRKMFLDEARLASSLSHAHIVQVHELARDGDLDFIVMELVEGKPLSKILHGRSLPPDKVAELGLQVARALGKAHKRGLIHRDLKPANILVTAEGEVKVVDFGLAALFSPGTDSSAGSDESRGAASQTPTRSAPHRDARPGRGELAGTLPYMAPEQVRREKLDTRSDVFSLGVVLYEMATGQRPFTGSTRAEIASEITKCRPKPIHALVAKVPLELERIVQKALAAKPAERYQTMEDLAVDLKRLGKELESGSSPSYESVQTGVTHHGRGLVGAIVAVVIAAIALGVMTWRFGWISIEPALDAHTILVLPFEVRGQEKDAAYAGRAFAEGIVIDLAQAQGLRVLPVPGAAQVAATASMNPTEIAAVNGAGRVVTGSLTRDGERVKVTASLVEAATNRVLWGVEKEDPQGDLSDLVSTVVREMSLKLGINRPARYGEFAEGVMKGPTAKQPAAAEFAGAFQRADITAELASAKRLVEAFPENLAARSALGIALWDVWYHDPSSEHLDDVRAELPALDRLDPRNPYVAYIRGLINRSSAPASARDAFAKLLEREDLSPRLRAQILRQKGLVESNLGDNDAALADARESVSLDPTNGYVLSSLSRALSIAGRLDESEVVARQAVALVPSYAYVWEQLGLSLERKGKIDEALSSLQRACELAGNQETCAIFVDALERNGHRQEALSWARKAGAMTDSIYGTYNLACYYALAGDQDQALAWLRRTLSLGFSAAWIEQDTDLRSLRGNPEFERIVAEVKRRIGKK